MMKQTLRHLRRAQILLEAITNLTSRVAQETGGDEVCTADALARMLRDENRKMLRQLKRFALDPDQDEVEDEADEEAVANRPRPK